MTTAVPPSHRNPSQGDDDVPDSFGLSGESDEWMDRVREAETPATLGCIGPYKLIEEVSRGGQGIVYRARQPGTKREIVVKRLLAGSFATPVMLRRFEREVELAASLSHPNIVTVFGIEIIDGQPLLAMEWIDGVPIDEWAASGESGRRSPKQIASMMHDVCDAVRHAHQHGVIHRDLKPTNILVDQAGVPHVLDFGLARPISPEGEGGATITLTEQFVGTPAYASPEHLRSGTSAIDVRADVYSLGLVLYNALTGRLPYDVSGDLPDVFHRIEHAEPIRPSSVAAHLDREIESIVLKALVKEKERRYQSVDLLAEDLRRYVQGEPVSAHPPSTFYQVRKIVKRHRIPFALALVVFMTLLAFSVTVSYQASRISEQRDLARAEAEKAQVVNDFLLRMVGSPDPNQDGRNVRVVDLLSEAAKRVDDSFSAQPGIQATLHETIGGTYRGLGLYGEAHEHFADALDIARANLGKEHKDTLRIMRQLGSVLRQLGRWEEADRTLRSCLDTLRRLEGEEAPETLDTTHDLAILWYEQGHYDEAERILLEGLEIYQRKHGPAHPGTLTWRSTLAMNLRAAGKPVEAEPLLREVLDRQRVALHDKHPDLLATLNNLGDLLTELDQKDEAENLLREALQGCTDVYGPQHANTIETLNNLATVLRERGKFQDAEPLFQRALDGNRSTLGREHPRTVAAMNNLAHVLKQQNKLEQAEPLYREAIEVAEQVLGEEHPNTLGAMNNLAGLLRSQGKTREAADVFASLVTKGRAALPEGHWLIAVFQLGHGMTLFDLEEYAAAEGPLRGGYEIMQATYGSDHPRTHHACRNLVKLYEAWGKPDKADEYGALLTEER